MTANLLDLGVYPVTGEVGRYHVRSSIHKGLPYLVDLDELDCGWCGCPHFEYRVRLQLAPSSECKHIRAAKMYHRLRRRFGKGKAMAMKREAGQ